MVSVLPPNESSSAHSSDAPAPTHRWVAQHAEDQASADTSMVQELEMKKQELEEKEKEKDDAMSEANRRIGDMTVMRTLPPMPDHLTLHRSFARVLTRPFACHPLRQRGRPTRKSAYKLKRNNWNKRSFRWKIRTVMSSSCWKIRTVMSSLRCTSELFLW